MRAGIAIALAAVCSACDIDQVPRSIEPLADCVQPDGGVELDVAVQARDGAGEPINGVPLIWELQPLDPTQPALDAGQPDAGDAGPPSALVLVRLDDHTRTQAIGTTVSPGIGKAIVFVDPTVHRESDSFVLAFVNSVNVPHAFIRIPRTGAGCLTPDGGSGATR